MFIFGKLKKDISINVLTFSRLLILVSLSRESEINHPNYGLLPKECGISYADRIIGGEIPPMGKYPWLARLGFILPDCTEKILYRCGGALINDIYVLTAAHCVYDLPTVSCPNTGKAVTFVLGSVLLGDYNSTSDPDCDEEICAPPVQFFVPEAIIMHPEYNHPQFAHDICLIRLNRRAELNGWVFPICLPHGDQLQKSYTGEIVEVAGWGTTDASRPKSSPILMFVRVPIVGIEDCVASFEKKLTLSSERQLCAGGQENKDSCSGDSGGPLMFVEAYEGPPRYYALGLVSFGVSRCGRKGRPAIYTRVGTYSEWILDNLKP